jgi:hypothetical protein
VGGPCCYNGFEEVESFFKEVEVVKKVFALCAVAAVLLVGSSASARELSAKMVVKEGGETYISRLYIKGEKYRVEVEGQKGYSILRTDRNTMWIVLPDQKAYIEVALDPAQKPRVQQRFPNEVGRRLVGTETVNGHPSEKYEVTLKDGDKKDTIYQWVATDLDDFPLRTAAVDGSWSTDYEDIRTSVPDSMFEMPSDYERLSVRSTPGGGSSKPKR